MAQVSYGTITITDITDIDNIKNYYLATSASSGVTTSTSGWTPGIQNMDSTKQYLWNYEQILGAGEVVISTTTPVIIGRYGQNGVSITSIDEYYKASSSDSQIPSSWNTVNVIDKPTATNKYLWNYQVIHYSNGSTEGSSAEARIIGVYGDKGDKGDKGDPGTAGINTATVYLYQRASSTPSKPSGNLTYTFSTGVLSGTLGSWKQSIGELTGTNPIWIIAAVASSNGTTDTIVSSDWSTQIKLAQNGTDGLNQATIYIYKRATSATAPSATSYTFSTGAFTVPSGWSKTIPASDGNPCYVTSAVAISDSTTATLNWVTPSVLVEDGTDGISPTVVATSNGVKITDADGNVTTITNGTNGVSYYTHIRYSASSNGANMVSTPTSSTIYMGVYTGTSSTAPTAPSSYTWSKYMGIDGVSVTNVVPIYYLKTSSGAAPTAPTAGTAITSTSTGTGVWTTAMPDYVSGGTYYTCTQTYLSSGTSPISSTAVQDKALTNANSTALNALNIAQGINHYYWHLSQDETHGNNTFVSGSYITQITDDAFLANPSDKSNLLLRSDGVYLNLGLQTLASFKSNALTFYNSAGAELGTFGSTGLDMSGTLNIRGGGRIGQDSDNYWEFGDNKSYNSEDSAYLIGKGTASIQLGETGHWRLDSNRIHTGWYQLSDGTAGILHFDTGAEGNTTYYWDYGLHYPNKSGNGNNKFLYVRRSSSSTSTSLATMKGRIDDDDFWVYKFYVDGDGNVHAPAYYVGNEPLTGGVGSIAEKIINSDSTYGKGSLTQPIFIDSNGRPATTTYVLNAAGAKDVVTDITNNASSTNLPTTAAVVSYVTSRGYITSYTDNKVQTSQANTTKIFLAGTSTSGTSTGTLSYDSNVYLTTTAGTLHATTFEGNLSGTATKANQDGDGNVIKTTYLKLSGGNVTGAVSFGSSVSADELIVGDLVVNGAASFTNNLQANTINGVAVGSNPNFTNTTYTFTNGTNGFTVTPSGGDAQTVTVTTSISNNITGTGTRTSGYLVKFSGTNTITNGPAIGTGTTKFLREDGTWVVPGGTYSLPTATSSVLGGVKVGSGLSISDGVLSHTDTSSQASSSNSGRTYIQSITLDTYGHVTGLTTASESVTDTHYTTHLYAGKSDGNANAATTNGNTYLMVLDNTTVRDRRKISGSGAASVTSDANGNITINSPVAITSVSFANGTITFTKSDSTTIPITTDNFVITQASGATALVKLKSGSTTEYEGYSAGGATTAPVYFDINGHPVAVTSIPASLISGSVTPTSHNHSQIITVGDQRSTATTPNDYVNALIFKGLKNKATIDNPSSDTYSYLIGLRGWSDSSGGRSHEIAFNNTGIFVRQESTSTANTWDSWYRIYTTGNKPTKSDVGLGNVDNTADANKRVKGANITTTANAVAYYTDTVGTFGSKASANGVLYATSANGALNWGTLPIAQGGTGKTTALAAITNLGGPYILAGGTEITASSNLDTDYTAAGTYYSSNSTRSASLSGTVVAIDSGFKMITMKGYRDQNILQFANWNDDKLLYRYSNAATVSFGKWYQLVRLPSGSDNKTFAAIGGSTQPVYVNSSGVVTACTSYANATVGKSNKTGAADLTTTANAIAYYTDTAGTFGSKASANGALYATSANGALNWGTLPVAQGGTGNTSFTQYRLTYAETATKQSSVPNISYYTGTSTASTPATYNRLHIHGSTYGNTAATLISGTAGLFSFGDGGPQITFDTNATPGNAQAGALIFTDHDTAATGASWHFVSNQSDWNVTSKRFHARTSISIGQNLPNTSYNLYVNGTSYLNGSTTVNGDTLKITNYNNTVTIGSQSSSFTHIYNSTSIPFLFDSSILYRERDGREGNLGNVSFPFENVNITGGYNMISSGAQKAAMHYDSTLEAIVFSFA